MLNLNQYQKAVITDKIYDESVAIPYVVLGIAGESSELYEKIIEQLGFGEDYDLDLLSKEVGDVLWYLAAYADETNQQLEDLESLVEFEPCGSIQEILDDLVLYTGAISEYTKKALRDDFDDIKVGKYPANKILKVNICVAELIVVLKKISCYYSLGLDTIIQENIDKLSSRAKRGTLKGSGDVR